MSPFQSFLSGKGNADRMSHAPKIQRNTHVARVDVEEFATQGAGFRLPHFPFQPLPRPTGKSPFRYDLSRILRSDDLATINSEGVMVVHTVGDTGDFRGRQQDFVAGMMTHDAEISSDKRKPAFFYHLGDVVYFAGDINKYGDNFYETYKDYPAFIVSIPGNHDCQPDDPQDGPVDPNKSPLDGWVQNFMSTDPSALGSLKTNSHRTQMDLPNVFWTFTTPVATIVGLFSNVGETEGEIRQDQIDWFRGELKAADKNLPLIVAVHHPPFSGDTEHSGSTDVFKVLFDSFKTVKRYPHLILSGHVHNYQRFTYQATKQIQVPCIVVGNGGYTNLGKLHKLGGQFPGVPLQIGSDLVLEQYDQNNFGFLRLEISKSQIIGKYFSAPYDPGASTPIGVLKERFTVDVAARSVHTD